jgi:cell division protein FtsB
MSKQKYILVLIILLWIFGFWFMFGGDQKLDENTLSSDVDALNKIWYKRIEIAEKELETLKEQNTKNELLIKTLK